MKTKTSKPKVTGYAVASGDAIMTVVGWGQALYGDGISLNQVYQTLSRIRRAPQRVHYQQVRVVLEELEQQGVLISGQRARGGWQTWKLADWAGWVAGLEIPMPVLQDVGDVGISEQLRQTYWDENLDGPRPENRQ